MNKFTKKSGGKMFSTIEEVEQFFQERMNEGIKPGLERMEELLAFANNPEKKTKFIHVAGTNGKGSTISYIKSGLRAMNLKVGVFSSPSLTGLLGHFTINDKNIDEHDFINLLNQIYPKIKEMDEKLDPPTEFEIITTIAFMYFNGRVDVAIIEVGMGGRMDTTNCITPVISVITNVSIDHTNFLGSTLEEIAKEKAGIIKHNCPVIVGETKDKALSKIIEEANDKDAPIVLREKNFTVENIKVDRQYTTYELVIAKEKFTLQIKAKGVYQVLNSSLAAVALINLKRLGLPIKLEDSFLAFRDVEIPGRFEVVSKEPLIIVDGAHNVEGIEQLISTVKEHFPNEEKTLVFSAFRDKQIKEMLTLLIPHFNNIVLTTFDHPRAATLEQLKNAIPEDIDVYANTLLKTIQSVKNEKKKELTIRIGSLNFLKIIRNYFN